MSRCEDFRERLCEFLDGELEQADRAAVQAHLDRCSHCRDELTELGRAAFAVQTLERRAVPDAVLAGVREGLKKAPTPEVPNIVRPEPSVWWRRAVSAAAVLIIGCLIYLAYEPITMEHRAAAPDATKDRKSEGVPAEAAKAARKDVPGRESKTAHRDRAGVKQAAPVVDSYKQDGLAAPTHSDNHKGAHFKRTREDNPVREAEPGEAAAELLPNATVPVGTPPNITEEPRKIAPPKSLLQQWKERVNDAKVADGDADQGAQELAETNDSRAKMKQVQTASKPAASNATVTSLEDAQTAGQTTGRQDQLRQVGARREEEKNRQALKTAQTRDAGAQAGKDDSWSKAKAESRAARLADTTKVLKVPQRDVARVLKDLNQLAKLSGGELARLSASPGAPRERLQKKSLKALSAAQEPALDRIVIYIPAENMQRFLSAATQYQAELLLDAEQASPPSMGGDDSQGQRLNEASRALLNKRQQANEAPNKQYTQLVVEIRPRESAAEAAKPAQSAPAKAE